MHQCYPQQKREEKIRDRHDLLAGAGHLPGKNISSKEKAATNVGQKIERLSSVMSEDDDYYEDGRRLEMNDQKVLVEYIKNDLFPKVKFVYDNKDWDVGKKIYNDYLKKCKDKMGLRTKTETERKKHMEKIWLSAQTKDLQKKALVQKRSAVYTVMRNKFEGKYDLACALNKIYYENSLVDA
jgi:hypothetical protein